MTVSSSTARQALATNGVTTAFSIPFYFIDNSHIRAYYATAAGVETLLVLNTDYTLTGAGNPSGGTLTTTGSLSPLATGTITIIRNIPLTQLTDYLTADSFPADSHERALDLMVMALQQFNEQLSRSMLFGVSEGAITFPNATDRAGYILGFDEDGAPELVAPETAFAGINKKETIWVPAGAMTARTTNGAAFGSTELSSNKVMVTSLDFDSSTAEYAQFSVAMPKSWNEGTLTFVPVWSHAATTTNFGVTWKLRALALSNDDAMDAAFGTAQSSTDTGGTTNDLYQGPESSAITAAGTPAESDVLLFEVYRDPSDGSDTMAIDARLHGIKVIYTRDAESDA